MSELALDAYLSSREHAAPPQVEHAFSPAGWAVDGALSACASLLVSPWFLPAYLPLLAISDAEIAMTITLLAFALRGALLMGAAAYGMAMLRGRVGPMTGLGAGLTASILLASLALSVVWGAAMGPGLSTGYITEYVLLTLWGMMPWHVLLLLATPFYAALRAEGGRSRLLMVGVGVLGGLLQSLWWAVV